MTETDSFIGLLVKTAKSMESTLITDQPATFYPEGLDYWLGPVDQNGKQTLTSCGSKTREMKARVHLATNLRDNTVNIPNSWVTLNGQPLKGETDTRRYFVGMTDGSGHIPVVVCGDLTYSKQTSSNGARKIKAGWAFESLPSQTRE
jgi:hypothetical protein